MAFTCNTHKEKGVQERDWSHFKRMKGCVYCSGKLKTTDDFKKEIETKQPNVEILNEYTGSDTKNRIYCRCKICGYEWDTAPASLRNGSGCPKCGKRMSSKKQRKSHDDFISNLHEVQPNIEILSEYTGTHKIIKCKCKIHACEWNTYPANLLNNTAHCPECTKEKHKKEQMMKHDEFIDKLESIRQDVDILEKYKGSHNKILCKCRMHGDEFYTTPVHLYRLQHSCPSCQLEFTNSSKGERAIAKYLNDNNYHYIFQYRFKDCVYKSVLSFDFYLPEYNLIIEYDGEQHFEPRYFNGMSEENAIKNFNKGQLRDEIKNQYCDDHNIQLIRIPYWDFKNTDYILNEKLNYLDPQRLSYSA